MRDNSTILKFVYFLFSYFHDLQDLMLVMRLHLKFHSFMLKLEDA